jgi:hypothetical protein
MGILHKILQERLLVLYFASRCLLPVLRIGEGAYKLLGRGRKEREPLGHRRGMHVDDIAAKERDTRNSFSIHRLSSS